MSYEKEVPKVIIWYYGLERKKKKIPNAAGYIFAGSEFYPDGSAISGLFKNPARIR